eukprot:scaffold677084_cov59-Prasinocladus_malaysianus.AAC.1
MAFVVGCYISDTTEHLAAIVQVTILVAFAVGYVMYLVVLAFTQYQLTAAWASEDSHSLNMTLPELAKLMKKHIEQRYSGFVQAFARFFVAYIWPAVGPCSWPAR